ncbi:MAG: hypothetical protein ABGY29_16985, partial [bacterium]
MRLDAIGIMLGEPRTEARRAQLRFEFVDYMLMHAENAALHRALKNAHELSIPHDGGEDLVATHVPLLFHECDSDASDDEYGVVTRAGETADVRTFPDVVVDAVAWASGLEKCDAQKALSLCRSLPSWCLDEQVQKHSEAQAAGPSSGSTQPSAQAAGPAVPGVHRSSLLSVRRRSVEMFEEFVKKRASNLDLGCLCPGARSQSISKPT